MAERYFRPQQFADYQSDYAGSLVPAFMQTAGALQKRYDEGVEQEDTLMSQLDNVSALDFDADQEYKRRLLDHYRTRLQQRAASGDYENMGRAIRQDALSFVKASQPLAQRMQQYQDRVEQIRDSEDLFDVSKKGFLAQDRSMNAKLGLRDPDAGFTMDAFNPLNFQGTVKDMDEGERALEIGKMLKAEKYGGANWEEVHHDDGTMFLKNKTTGERVTSDRVTAAVNAGIRADADTMQSIRQRARMMANATGQDSRALEEAMIARATEAAVKTHVFNSKVHDQDLRFSRDPSSGQNSSIFTNAGALQYNLDSVREQYKGGFSKFRNDQTNTNIDASQYRVMAGDPTGANTRAEQMKIANQYITAQKNLREKTYRNPEDYFTAAIGSGNQMLRAEGNKMRELSRNIPKNADESTEQYLDRLQGSLDAFHANALETVDVVEYDERNRKASTARSFGDKAGDGEGTRTGIADITHGQLIINGVPTHSGNLKEILNAEGIDFDDFKNKATSVGVVMPNSTSSGGESFIYSDGNKTVQIHSQNSGLVTEEVFQPLHIMERDVQHNLTNGKHFQTDGQGNRFTSSAPTPAVPLPDGSTGHVVKRAYMDYSDPSNPVVHNTYAVYSPEQYNSVSKKVSGEPIAQMEAKDWNLYIRDITNSLLDQ